MQWWPQGPPLPPPKTMQINWGFSLKLQTTTFRAIMHSCICSLVRHLVAPKNIRFPYLWGTCPARGHQCDQPLASNGHFGQPVLSFRPLLCPLGAAGRPSGLSNGLGCQLLGLNFIFLAPTWHLHTSCCPKLGQHLVASASSVPNSRPLPLRFLSLAIYLSTFRSSIRRHVSIYR